MDRHDLAILREMTQEHGFLWGGVDPRATSTDIAAGVDLHPSTVRARLREWRQSGFLQGYEIVPNHQLLDAHVMVTSVRIDQPQHKAAFFEELGLVEGAYAAIDHVGPWIGVVFHVEHPDAVPRRTQHLARLPGVDHVEDPFPGTFPRPKVNPSRLDWRIVRELRRQPNAPLQETADRVGVTAKTLRRRYDNLIQGQAIGSVAVLDFRGYTGGALVRADLYLTDDADIAEVKMRFRDAVLEAVEINPAPPDPPGATPPPHPNLAQFLVHIPSAAEADGVLVTASQLDGVAEAEILFPVCFHRYPQWIDERVDRLAEGGAPDPGG